MERYKPSNNLKITQDTTNDGSILARFGERPTRLNPDRDIIFTAEVNGSCRNPVTGNVHWDGEVVGVMHLFAQSGVCIEVQKIVIAEGWPRALIAKKLLKYAWIVIEPNSTNGSMTKGGVGPQPIYYYVDAGNDLLSAYQEMCFKPLREFNAEEQGVFAKCSKERSPYAKKIVEADRKETLDA